MKKYALSGLFLLIFISSLFTSEEYLQKADKNFQDGKFALAEIYYRKVLQEKPDNFQANYNLGKVLYYNNKYKDSLKYLQTAYDIKPDRDIQFLMARDYVESGEVKQGLSIYSNLLQDDSHYSDAHLEAGLVFLKYLYDKKGTIYHWETFLIQKPNDEQAPQIRKALEYLRDPNFVLKPPDDGKTSDTGTVTLKGDEGSSVIIKGKDLKTKSEDKYKLKDKKTITTE
ncbi:MAG: tetratricopeptide repeat protein [Spirochaetes bacterium]|nr:tetratricopeptide repeat protein [Spirochaetota bacterium]